MYAVLIDVSVMLLLLLTIVFCWRLNNKITELKSGRRDLLELVKALDSAIIKTNSNIAELRSMSQNSTAGLNALVTMAKTNINDLNFINETANKLADRLEKNISDARSISNSIDSDYNRFNNENTMVNPINTQHNKPKVVNSNLRIFHSGFTKAKEELISALRFVK